MAMPPEPGSGPDAATRLSTSDLWGRLRRFYERRGPRAWAIDGVPNHVTINPGMARRYAHVALRYAQDCRRLGLGATGPFPVVELGAGSGGFGYRLHQALAGLAGTLALDDLRLVQVMSDVAASNLESWREQSGLGPLLAQGAVTAALFDAMAGEAVGPIGREPTAPPVFVANYLFDSLPMDLFRVTGGQLHEALVTVDAPPEGDEPPDLSAVAIRWTYRPVSLPYYGDAALDATLADCLGQARDDYWVLFPLGAMRCLARLRAMVDGPLLVIAGDLGSTRFPSFPLEEPQLVIPGAYFYAPVDFGLLAKYAARLDGHVVHQARDRVLNISLFSFGVPFAQLRETKVAADIFFDMVSHSVVYDSMRHMLESGAPPSLPLFLDLAAAGSFDPVLFDGMVEVLQAELRAGIHPPELWEQLVEILDRFVGNVFVTPGGADTVFLIASLLQELQDYPRALAFYEQSSRLFGETSATLYNMGVCRYLAGQADEAVALLERVVALDPTHVMARGWIAQIAHDLAEVEG